MSAKLHNTLALAVALLGGMNGCGASERVTSGISDGIKHVKAVRSDYTVDLRVTLAPRNHAALAASIAAGEVLTPAQYHERHAPTADDIAAASGYLISHGITAVHDGGHVLRMSATQGQIHSAFGVNMLTFKNTHGDTMRTKDGWPKWPGHLPRAVVTGLSSKPAKVGHAHVVGDKQEHLDALVAHEDQGALSAGAIRSIYNMPAGSQGQGQTVAMVELDGYDPADLDTYAAQMGIRRVPTTNVLIGTDGSIQDQGARGEVTLDIELAMAMAPQLSSIVVYEAANSDHALNDIFNRLANPQRGEQLIKSISCSWGEPESYMTQAQARAESIILQQLAAQGQTVFAASGDSGARDDGSHLGTDDPASQPYAVGVGGTRVHSINGIWTSEATWAGSGGGISHWWMAPSWQKGIEGRATHASLTLRDVPDVAMNADPNSGYAVYVGGWQQVGGTSCAAPLWAAVLACANGDRAAANKPALPYFAPLLYKIAPTTQGRAAIRDVADRHTNGYFPAVNGLDAATGWGSPNGSVLLPLLVAE